MTTNRLNELKANAPAIELMTPIDHDQNHAPGTSDNLQQFYRDIEIIKKHIDLIKTATAKIANLNYIVIQATTKQQEESAAAELQPTLVATNKKAAYTKQFIQRLHDENKQIKATKGGEKTPEYRIRDNVVSTMTRKFVDVMKDYQSAQTKYKNDVKLKVKRAVKAIKQDATNEEIEAVMQSGGVAKFVEQSILSDQPADAIRHAHQEVSDRYQDILVLEASVAELHQMFLDFAVLTEKQGEMLDQIEHQVGQASEYIGDGNVDLGKSIELIISIRAKQCCLLAFVLVVIAIVVGLAVAGSKGGL